MRPDTFHTPVQSPIVKLQSTGGNSALAGGGVSSSAALAALATTSERPRPQSAGAAGGGSQVSSANSSSNFIQRPSTARPGTAAPAGGKKAAGSAASSSSALEIAKQKRAAAVEVVLNLSGHSVHGVAGGRSSSSVAAAAAAAASAAGGRSVSAAVTTGSSSQHYNAHEIVSRHAGHIVATSPHHGLMVTPLDVEDVEMSVRLMHCLDSLKRPANGPHQDVEKRFRGHLRTTTQATRDVDWERRMASVRALRERKQAEVHKRTQMHQLFKHYAFEQRMAARSNTPSVAAAAAAAISGASSVGADGLSITSSSAAAGVRGGAGAAAASLTLFPTTPNSLTRTQMEEYFAVPSFVRPLLSTFRRPDGGSYGPTSLNNSAVGHQPHAQQHYSVHSVGGSTFSAAHAAMMGARSVSVSSTGAANHYSPSSVHPHHHNQQQQHLMNMIINAPGSRSSSSLDPAGFAEHVAEQIDASRHSAQNSQNEESFARARAALSSTQQPTELSPSRQGRPFR